jgi:hypothetical protein
LHTRTHMRVGSLSLHPYLSLSICLTLSSLPLPLPSLPLPAFSLFSHSPAISPCRFLHHSVSAFPSHPTSHHFIPPFPSLPPPASVSPLSFTPSFHFARSLFLPRSISLALLHPLVPFCSLSFPSSFQFARSRSLARSVSLALLHSSPGHSPLRVCVSCTPSHAHSRAHAHTAGML